MRCNWKILLVCIFSIVFFLLRAETKFYYFDSKKTKITFPFRLFNNILVVDVKVNKTKTLKFIFDSGCKSTIIIHPKWLDSFDIPYKQKVYFSGLGFKDSVETMKIDNGTLQVGELKGEHIPIFILSKDSLSIENYLGTDVDGIFGAEIFEKYYVHISYKKRLIELYSKKPEKKLNASFQKMAVDIRKSKGYLSCMVMNNKKELFLSELLLDTGSNVPVIIKNKDPADLHIDHFIDAEIGEGLSGPIYSRVCRIKRIFIDTLKFDSVVTVFNETPISFRDLNENTLDGNIGNDIMNRLDLYFAYPEKAIYFRPNSTIKDPFYFNISNIILLENKSKNGGFIVKSIAGNSPPLLAGLQKGDEIIKIDYYSCDGLKLEDALTLLNKRIGRKITLHYRRNNVISKISYKLVSII
ncbi:MAG: aspartate aminotransferase [Bacteroidota bacterium]|nr:aspartate aminotransferase [Bacteroidota bacterium]